MKQSIISLAIIGILLVLPVYAGLEADTAIIENSIYMDENAKYRITLENTDTLPKSLQIYTTSVRWYVEVDPFITIIQGGESITAELRLVPSVWAETGAQAVDIFIESTTTKERIALEVPVYLKSFGDIDKKYNPSVEMKASFPERVDPREMVPLEIYLRNRNRLDIKEMELIVQSKHFYSQKVLPLEPLSEGREMISYKIGDLTPPGDDELEIFLRVENRTINRERFSFQINEFKELITKTDTIEELFKKTIEYTIINEANVERKDPYRIETSILKTLFTKATPSPTKINLVKGAYLEWDMDLEPRGETKVVVVENYRSLIYAVLIGIVVCMIYFLYRSPLVIKKEAVILSTSHEGISEMKVLLHVRNRSQELIEHLTITDLVPSLADVKKETHIGTLSPSKIVRNDKKGTIIKWELEVLEPFEERIITYRLESKIAIVGGLSLPPAKVKFEAKGGKERVVRSNVSQVSMGL